MKSLLRLIFLILISIIGSGLYAQRPDASIAQLKKNDVERFIQHFKSIEKEFERLDVKYSPESDLNSFTEAIDNINEVEAVVKKYGYSDINSFVVQAWAISVSYASIKMETGGSDEYQKAIKGIENDTTLSEEEKIQAIGQLRQVMGAVGSAFVSMVHEKDIETVRPFISQLDVILDEE